MDSHNNNGFTNNSNGMFSDSQNFNAYDNLNLFQHGTDSNFPDASWGLNPSPHDFVNANSNQSRAIPQQAVPSWQQNANHITTHSTHQQGFNGQGSPYGRSMNHSPAPFGQTNFPNYPGQQNFPYRQSQYDPSLSAPTRNGQNFSVTSQNYGASQIAGTIAPQALDQNRAFNNSPYAVNSMAPNAFGQNRQAIPSIQSQAKRANPVELANAVPKGADAGLFSIINFDELSRATNSERMGNFANIGKEAHEWDITRSAVPLHVPRRSRNELRALAGNNASALAKIGKRSKILKTMSKDGKPSSMSSPQIRYDNTSSSGDDSSTSDDDSEYSDDDDEDSPLPAKRPDSPKAGVEYDVIKAVYRNKRKILDNATIAKGLADFWDIIKIIRDRWKADTAAVTDAEEKKKVGDLPLLKSRVKDQRDMMEAAFKAAVRHGHRRIIEL